ncbi:MULTISPECIES: phage tail sheath subtilisin-like domain-containing protein [unclassified Microcoleus]|uniref:phage tail sheath subtilisin-like domain-containing protein n=1 Tax=unclassified Microcoleus TaxID=2642155 RepID=UPI002FD3E600
MPNYSSPGVYVEEVPSGSAPITGVGTSTAGFIGIIPSSQPSAPQEPANSQLEAKRSGENVESTSSQLPGGEVATSTDQGISGTSSSTRTKSARSSSQSTTATLTSRSGEVEKTTQNILVPPNEVKLCTNFSEFEKFFGSLSSSDTQKPKTETPHLAHAVYGFFRNGGTRCYVVQVNGDTDINNALEKFEAIDEIAIVAAPGCNISLGQMIVEHCKKMRDRFAILDCTEDADHTNILKPTNKPPDSEYGAFYFPWIQVFDPEDSKKEKYVPPSGHIAGIYARVDAERGVHKAPANEIVFGARGLKQNLSKNQQDGLNPKGINCIRNLNGNIRVWGARTIGGDANGEFKYINVRRLFNYLKKSIDHGTQWTVFEPNSPELWAKIRRNVTSFLMTVWRSGALFGSTPEQAFYVKCDEETNPPELREQGQVITEIGVAIVKPAEFVIFNLSQWSEPGK